MTSLQQPQWGSTQQPPTTQWPPTVIPAVWPPPLPGVPSSSPPPSRWTPPPPPLFPQVPQVQQIQLNPPPSSQLAPNPNSLPLGGQVPRVPPAATVPMPPPAVNIPPPAATVPPVVSPAAPSNRNSSILPSTLARWGRSLQGSLFGENRPPTIPIGHSTISIGTNRQSAQGSSFIVDSITDMEKTVILILTLILSSFSILAALLMIVIYFICRHIYPTLVDRITLRICILIAAVDLFYAVNQMWSAFASHSSIACSLSVWAYIFLTLLFIFLTDAIAFNLHMVFLVERRNTSRLEKWYYIIPLSFATAASVPGWAAGRYGWDPSMKTCWFIEQGTPTTLVWEFMSYYTWAVLGILYCVVIVFMVLNKLFTQRRKLEKALTDAANKSDYRYSRKFSAVSRRSSKAIAKQLHTLTPDQVQLLQQREASKETSRIVLRIVRYPMIPIFTQVWNITNDLTLFTTKRTYFWLLLMCYIATSLQGVLNFLAFSYDPSIQQALDELKSDAIDWYQNDQELLQRSGLENQAATVFTLKKRMLRALVWFWYVRRLSPDDRTTVNDDTLSQATLEKLNKSLSMIEEEEEETGSDDTVEVEIVFPSPPTYPLPALQQSSVRFDNSVNMEQGWLRPTGSGGELMTTSRRSSGIRSRGNSLSSVVPPQF